MEFNTNKDCPDFGEFLNGRERIWRKLQGKSGRVWLIPINKNPADTVHVSANPRENEADYRGFRGYGGRTLKFELEDGSVLELTGPWHSNSIALYEDTGYDIRDRHVTFGVVSEKRDLNDRLGYILSDILYKDATLTFGRFNRIKNIAQEFADKLNKKVFYFMKSRGGSSCGPVFPKEKE